jgi:hypothetical protein
VYDPAKHEAPLCVGHPEHDKPAYGWAKRAAFADGALQIEPHQVDPAFEEMVQSGRFKKRSASFYPPNAKSNPVPGSYYLRHVAFLGAQPPSVKGLRDAAFADDGSEAIEFTDWHGMQIAGIFRRIKNWIIDSAGQEKADTIMPEYELENLTVSAAKKDDAPAYSESLAGDPTMDAKEKEQLAAREAALKADKEKLERDRAEFAEKQKQLDAATSAATRAKAQRESAELVDGLVKEGKVLPAQRDGLVAFMASQSAEGVIEFGEGDKAVKKPAAEWLRDYLKAQPKVIEFAERGKGNGAELPDNADADDIAKRAVEFQEAEKKAGRTITVTAAVAHVTKQAAQ